MRYRVGLRVLGLVVVAGCVGEGGKAGEETLPPAEASARVTELLYGQNLVADPQVNAKMNEYVLAVSRDGVPVGSVMPEFHRWLAAWARAHPDRVAAVRLQPGSAAAARAAPAAPAVQERPVPSTETAYRMKKHRKS